MNYGDHPRDPTWKGVSFSEYLKEFLAVNSPKIFPIERTQNDVKETRDSFRFSHVENFKTIFFRGLIPILLAPVISAFLLLFSFLPFSIK